MKITMQDAANLTQIISPWLDNTDLTILTKYKLAKLYKKVSEENEFYKTSVNGLIAKYAVTKPDGTYEQQGEQVVIKPEKINEFNSKLQELWNIEVDIPDELQFEIADLEPLNPTARMLMVFDPLIK